MTKKKLLMFGALAGLLATATAWAAGPAFSGSKVTIAYFEDVSATNMTGTLVVGTSGAEQVAIDNNEIQARNGSSSSPLALQVEGGDVQVHHHLDVRGSAEVGSALTVDGTLYANDNAFVETLYVPHILGTAAGGNLEIDGGTELVITDRVLMNANEIYFLQPINPPLDGYGSTELCLNSGGRVAQCNSSSRRFKADITDLNWGLREVMAMKAVSYTWKQDGRRDLGFIAEDAEGVVPELVQYKDGVVSGFDYRHYTAVLTRAIQEQQKAIEDDHRAISLRDQEILELRSELTAQGSTLADQAAELKKLRDEVSALSRAVASMTARP
jgi:hypothetical protein